MSDKDDEKRDRDSDIVHPPPSGVSPSSVGETLPLRGAPNSLDERGTSGTSGPSEQSKQAESSGVTFSSGQLIAARYKVIRFIGYGGMGEVYEVEDLGLHERVALKTVRPEIAANSLMIERFVREIQLARKVTHPNVCRVFDIGHHESGRPGEGVTFLTMELLAGETLANRLRIVGRMTHNDAFPIVTQMADGLDAAHKAGIVHRDFKPGNVMLVPSRDKGAGIRAVVTDFGLARRVYSSESFVASISAPGEVVGTPAYMAPEQVEGKDLTSAADIYAFGCVMFEMLTGAWPFKGDSPFSTAVKRIKEPPPSPRAFVPQIDPKWEATILRCLARDPAELFVSATDVLRALSGESVAMLRPAGPEAWRPLRWLGFATIVAFLVLAIVLGIHLYRDQLRREISPSFEVGLPRVPVKPRRTVAVLGFKNLSGLATNAWLSTALSEMLTTELAVGEQLRTVPGENVAQMRINLSLSESSAFSRETLAQIRTHLGTDLVVLGSYITLGRGAGEQIRVDMRLQDTMAGETIASVAATGTEANLFEVVSKAGATLRQKLGVGETTAADAGKVLASLPSNPEAARLYSQGLAKLRLYDAPAAKDLLQQAVEVEPQHPLPHAALARAWASLGYDGKARDEAKRALDLASNLPSEDRLLLEGDYHESTRDWAKAVETYQKLFHLYPDNIDHGLRLARVQAFANNPKEALIALKAVRKLPDPIGKDPRIDLTEASVSGSLSDFNRQLRIAEEAVTKGQKLGARLLLNLAK